jgi:hypothetical protein
MSEGYCDGCYGMLPIFSFRREVLIPQFLVWCGSDDCQTPAVHSSETELGLDRVAFPLSHPLLETANNKLILTLNNGFS